MFCRDASRQVRPDHLMTDYENQHQRAKKHSLVVITFPLKLGEGTAVFLGWPALENRRR